MPKRATHTFESEKDGVQTEQLNVCFCLCCGVSVCILGPKLSLAALPRRRTDGAHVLVRSEATFKLKTQPGEKICIKREGGYEPQWRFNCWSCGVPVAYTCTEEEKPELTCGRPLAAQRPLARGDDPATCLLARGHTSHCRLESHFLFLSAPCVPGTL